MLCYMGEILVNLFMIGVTVIRIPWEGMVVGSPNGCTVIPPSRITHLAMAQQCVPALWHIRISTSTRYLKFGSEASQHIKEILTECAEFAKYDINIKKENVINKFDETCQGTVPVALWIIGNSTSFEDAVRKAVSLGADADTLGAIVGSIAEAIWGIPKEMKLQALEYLPSDMKEVVTRFYSRYIKDGLW